MAYRDVGSQALRRPHLNIRSLLGAPRPPSGFASGLRPGGPMLGTGATDAMGPGPGANNAAIVAALSGAREMAGPRRSADPAAAAAIQAQMAQLNGGFSQPSALGLLGGQRTQGPLGQVGGAPAAAHPSGARSALTNIHPVLHPLFANDPASANQLVRSAMPQRRQSRPSIRSLLDAYLR